MKKVSQKIIDRVLVYIRTLEHLIKDNRHLVSSKQLAEITGITDVQIRKDISNFKKVGVPRIGYETQALKKVLEDFVLQKEIVRVALFGVGNLGSAILKYPGFQQERVRIVAAFDSDKVKIGKNINGHMILSIQDAPEIIKKTKAAIGIMAVPKEFAQQVADIMAISGVKGILNFVPTSINVPVSIKVKDIDLTIEFLSLFCDIYK
ncbi:MAG: redox-sensing transcriptional repressor Rex [Candidatus Omnitrophica bacterium]|nr:redox-sensing transcriptional repressor Rex [Candidatus Omnitrophota bacterium]